MGVRASFALAAILTACFYFLTNSGYWAWVDDWVGDLLIAVLGGFSLISVASESARIEPRNRLGHETTRCENAKRDLANCLANYSAQLPRGEFVPERPWAQWSKNVEKAARENPDDPGKILAAIESLDQTRLVYSNHHEERFVRSFIEYAEFFANNYRSAFAKVDKSRSHLEPSGLEEVFSFMAPILLAVATAIGIVKALV